MKRLALECPTGLLDKIQPLADFHFVLAHLVLSDKTYTEYYRIHNDKDLWLDNSVNELLEPVGLDKLVEAANIVKPDFVVAPDYLGDWEKTVRSFRDARKRFGDRKTVGVIQGEDITTCMECCKVYHQLGFDLVAVPYDIRCKRSAPVNEMAVSRFSLITALALRFRRMQFHLLGMTTTQELEEYGSEVVSIDTGVPIMLGLKDLGLDDLRSKSIPTLGNMPHLFGQTLEKTYYNIAHLRRLLNGRGE